MKCPHCNKDIANKLILPIASKLMGKSSTEKKRKAAKINGKLGGRPKIKRHT